MRPFDFEVSVSQFSERLGGPHAGKWAWTIILDGTMVRFADEDDVLHDTEAEARAEAAKAVKQLVAAMQGWLREQP